MGREYKFLKPSDVEHFLDKGWVRIPNAFSRESAAEWTKDVWTRLGMDPNDKSTWTRAWTNMPGTLASHISPKELLRVAHQSVPIYGHAPRAWEAMGDLLGGHERIMTDMRPSGTRGDHWGDSLIVNLGTDDMEGKEPPHPKELNGWHCDGDFLDSPEQGLLVVPIFSDIEPAGGGTMIATDSIGHIARHLADHPEGVMPNGFGFPDIRDKCEDFMELTGSIGDVVLMHPLMLHSASHNNRRVARIITNPAVSLREPFIFKRPNPDDYSLVEIKTLRALGKTPEEGYDWQIGGPRKEVIPDRLKYQAEWKKAEAERLRAAKQKGLGGGSGTALKA